LRVLYASLFVVIVDQVTKFFVKGLKIESLGISIPGMPYGSSKQVFGNFVKLRFIENPGMAFGVLISPRVLLPIIVFVALLSILYYIYRHREAVFVLRLALALIAAGAVGNLIDRSFYGLIYGYAPFFHGKVVDFIQFEFWDFTIFGKTYTSWPILNVADLSVTCGFLIVLVFHKRILKSVDEKLATTTSSDETQDEGSENFKEHSAGEIQVFTNQTGAKI
jgi:signal peptidase II